MSEHIGQEISNGVLTLTLNRPEKKNALTPAMYAALADGIDGADEDDRIRCILFQAEGDLFCAGNDIGDFAAANASANSSSSKPEPSPVRRENPLLAALARTKTPLVAAVNGKAIGVGTTMLLHCDLVFLAENAVLTTPFVNLALVPEAASSLLLTSRIGHARAFSMFVLGEPLDAKTAVAWGVANACVPLEDLRTRAHQAAALIASKPPASVRRTKSLMRDVEAIKVHMEREALHFGEQLRSSEAAEAFAAFAERRAPKFA